MRTGHSPRLGRLTLLTAMIVALLGTTLSATAAAVDPVGPAPATGQTWIVTLADHADAPREAPRLAAARGRAPARRVFARARRLRVHGLRERGRCTRTRSPRRARGGRPYAARGGRDRAEWDPAHERVGSSPGWIHRRDQQRDTGARRGGRHRHPARPTPTSRPTSLRGSAPTASTPGSRPNDDHGHGTHVAGTVAAAFNGQGVVGMATNAQLIPVKVLDSTGFGTDAQVICGLEYVAALAQSQPGPYVVNMSLGDPNRPGETTCGSSALHQAICDLTTQA